MRVLVVTPPAPVLTLDEVKAHLRVDGDDEDAVIAGMLAAATAHIDGPDGWLGRAIGVQTLELRLDSFLVGDIQLPCPPFVDIFSITVGDISGTPVTPTTYELIGVHLVPAPGASWPRLEPRREAVRIRYRAGYEQLPPAIRAAILLMVGDLYAFRSQVVTGTIAQAVPMSTTVANLLAPFRVWSA